MTTHRPCVSILLLRRGKKDEGLEVLIVHKPRKNDAWQIPQGGVEEGETPEAAARRELQEETGIKLQGKLHPAKHHYQYDYPPGFIRAKKPKYRGQRLDFFTAFVPGFLRVNVDKRELDTYRWVRPEEISKYLKRKEYLEVVSAVIADAMTKFEAQSPKHENG